MADLQRGPVALEFRVLPDGETTRVEFPKGTDPFAVLQRAIDWVDAAGGRIAGRKALDPKRETRDNAPRSPGPSASAAASSPPSRPPFDPPLRKAPETVSPPPPVVLDQTPPAPQDNAGTRPQAESVSEAALGGVRDTSMIAYRALQYSGALAKQQREIIDVFLRDPSRDWTRRELVDQVGIPINAVCGRVNELLKEPFELLVELSEKRDCRVTRNRVNALALAEVKPTGER